MKDKSAWRHAPTGGTSRSYAFYGESRSGTAVAWESRNSVPGAAMSSRILLVDPDTVDVARKHATLRDADCEIVVTLQRLDGIEGHLERFLPDALVVFSHAPGADILDSLARLMESHPLPIVVFAEDSNRETTVAAVRAGISAYVVAGWEPSRFRTILDTAIERFRQFETLRSELATTRNQLAERKRIERAKGILMRARNLSEDQAYQALRKQAMDRNKRLIDVAESVIAASELLS